MSSADRAIRRQEEQRERQRDFQREQNALQKAFNQNGQLSRGWMREILDTEDLEDHLQPFTIKKVQAMLNKQWVLANLTDAETHDRIYWLEVMKYKIIGEHPPEESSIQGPVRAFLFDDETEQLFSLTSQERNTIEQIIKGLQNMVTRSREGFERKQINTNIARTETETGATEQKGGRLRGLF